MLAKITQYRLAVTNTQLLMLLLGLLTPLWLPVLPGWLSWVLTAAGGVVMLSKRLRLLSCWLIAAGWSCWCADAAWRALPPQIYNQSVLVTGAVVDIPEATADRIQFVMQMEQPEFLSGRRFRMSWYRSEQIPVSDERWQFEVRLRPPVGAVNPYGFDYAQYLLASGFSGTGVIQSAQRLQTTPEFSLAALRVGLIDWLDDKLPTTTAALARALLVGDRSAISDAQREQLIATGTAHLLAISGMHVGLVAWLGYWLGRWLGPLLLQLLHWLVVGRVHGAHVGRWLSAHQAGVMLALLSAVSYASLAGLVVSTRRALLMLGLIFLAVLLRRQLLSGRTLLLAAVLIMAVEPLIVLGPAFWLSFGAVFWLWYGFGGRSGNLRGAGGKLLSLLQAQGLIFLGLLPVQLLWFQQASLSMLPANLLAIPLVSLLILPLLLVAALIRIGPDRLAELTLHCAGKILELLIYILDCIGEYSLSPYLHVPANHGVVILAFCGALWLLAPRGIPLRWLGVLLILPLTLTSSSTAPQPGHWQATILDAGQGQAVVIRTRNQLLLYDTGPGDGQGRDSARSSILPLLQSWQQPMHALIVSHGDLDHAGGLATIQAAFPRTPLITSDARLGEGCFKDRHWRYDGVDFTLLHPGKFLPYLRNDSSCVLLIESKLGSLLIPGDISEQIERRLLLDYPDLQTDVLLVPHHGSNSSSSAALLDQLQPRIAVASAGLWNRYAFPRPEVQQRYQQRGIQFYSTSVCGALEISTARNRTPVIRPASQWPRWWQTRITARDCEL